MSYIKTNKMNNLLKECGISPYWQEEKENYEIDENSFNFQSYEGSEVYKYNFISVNHEKYDFLNVIISGENKHEVDELERAKKTYLKFLKNLEKGIYTSKEKQNPEDCFEVKILGGCEHDHLKVRFRICMGPPPEQINKYLDDDHDLHPRGVHFPHNLYRYISKDDWQMNDGWWQHETFFHNNYHFRSTICAFLDGESLTQGPAHSYWYKRGVVNSLAFFWA